MKERKYKEDYGFATTIDHRGREKREAVYQGDWYKYEKDASPSGRMIALMGGMLCLCICFFLIYMSLNSPSSRCIYVMPVTACALVPMVYWAMGLFVMWRAPEKMTRLQKENGAGRVLRSSVGCMVLLSMACIGDLVFMAFTLRERYLEEVLPFAFLLCSAACAMGSFLRIRDIYTHMAVMVSAKEGEEK